MFCTGLVQQIMWFTYMSSDDEMDLKKLLSEMPNFLECDQPI